MDRKWNWLWDLLGIVVGGSIGLAIVLAFIGGLSAVFR